MEKPASSFSTRRIEALSDGVFGVAMTLLVLNVTIDHFSAIHSSQQLFVALGAMSTSIVSFVVSFLLVGTMWAVHARQFEYIVQANRHLMTLNLLRLLAVVFVPFTTNIATAYPDIELARVLLPLNFLALVAISSWEWRYATSGKRQLHSEHLTEARKRAASARDVYILTTAVLVVIAAWFVGQWAFLLFAAVPFVTKYLMKRFDLHI
jgi:uncharacterized membrane protein